MTLRITRRRVTAGLLAVLLAGAAAVPVARAVEGRPRPDVQHRPKVPKPPRRAGTDRVLAEAPGDAAGEAGDREAVERRVDLIVVDAGINPATADFIRESIIAAHHGGAEALIIELDTPGGLLDSTKLIVKDLLGAPLPVVVYVAPSGAGAASAGVFVTLAASVAAMAPGTNIGAAHPVGGQGETIGGDMREKVENFAASLMKTIAQERGRNVEWAEKAVRESVSITEQEALKLGVIDLVATNRDDLLRQLDGREVPVSSGKVHLHVADADIVIHDMRLKQKFLNILANPNVAYLLMMAGVLGLYVEFTHPGVFFPGVAGGICLLLGMTALQVLPINYSGLALIGLGLALLITELFLPSFGVLGVGGLVSFVLGSLLLFDTPESDLTIDPMIVYAAAATFAAFTFVVSYLVIGSQRRKPSLGREGLVGEVGEVRQRVDGRGGKVFVHGEYWNAVADQPLEPGEHAEVVGMKGMRLTVRRVPGNPPPVPTFNHGGAMIGPTATVLIVVLALVISGVKILKEYERGVVFRLGRLVDSRGPGIIYVIPLIERMQRIELRTITMDIPPQDVITRDNVSVKVSAVLYFRVIDPNRAVVEVADYLFATSQLAQTTLRSVCGQAELDELLAEREKINTRLAEILDTQTDPWGIKVATVEVKHIDLPQEMQRAMARQAEAERERRAKVINAEGEFQAAQKLADASAVIGQHPMALQLRFLQTLTEVASENNSTTIFPLPIDLLAPFMKREPKP